MRITARLVWTCPRAEATPAFDEAALPPLPSALLLLTLEEEDDASKEDCEAERVRVGPSEPEPPEEGACPPRPAAVFIMMMSMPGFFVFKDAKRSKPKCRRAHLPFSDCILPHLIEFFL
jgi:hypothetical protein